MLKQEAVPGIVLSIGAALAAIFSTVLFQEMLSDDSNGSAGGHGSAPLVTRYQVFDAGSALPER